jgi:hypothetical protein
VKASAPDEGIHELPVEAIGKALYMVSVQDVKGFYSLRLPWDGQRLRKTLLKKTKQPVS